MRVHVGRSVYYALCELGNEDRARTTVHADSARFRTTRKRICEQAGVSYNPADNALRELERIGLLSIEDAEGGGQRQGATGFYKLLEPDQTCGVAQQVEGNELVEEVNKTCGVAQQVENQPVEEVNKSLYRSRSKEKKEEKPHNVPDSILVPLYEVATAKEADLNPVAVDRAVQAYPDRDHAAEADAFLGWHRGAGANAQIKDVARGFRNWLKRATPSKRPNLTSIDGGGEGGTSPYGKKVIRSGNDD